MGKNAKSSYDIVLFEDILFVCIARTIGRSHKQTPLPGVLGKHLLVNVIDDRHLASAPIGGKQRLPHTVSRQPSDHRIGRQQLQRANNGIDVFLPLHRAIAALQINLTQPCTAQHVEQMQLDLMGTQSGGGTYRLQHPRLILSGEAENKMHADLCQIYTDVEGVYTADPRKVSGARKLSEITYDEMLELATSGAQVLNNRSVEMAKKYNVELEVRSSIKPVPGTKVKEVTKMEKMLIKGVAKDESVARVAVVGLPDSPGIAFKVFSRVAKAHVCVDNILQSIGRDGTKDIAFTVPADDGPEAVAALKEYCEMKGAKDLVCDTNVAKISVVGAGMETHEGVAADMFEALAAANINIQTISSSEIRVSVLVDKKDADRAVEAVHRKFFGE